MELTKILVIAGLLLLLAGCTGQPPLPQAQENAAVEPQNATPQPPAVLAPAPTLFDIANGSAHSFALESQTYAYDGSGLSLRNYSAANGLFGFTYTYVSSHSGFGNRSAYSLAQMQTPHTLVMRVSGEDVTSAVLDGAYDELRGEWIDVAKNFDLTPVDKAQSMQAAIDYVKGTDGFRKNARPGARVWIDDYYAGKLTDTAWSFTVFYETRAMTAGEYVREAVTVTVIRYVPYEHNKTLANKMWVDWYSDPTTDYSALISGIPDPKCPPGQLIAGNLNLKFCFPPTSTHGKPCSKTEDCERGACMRVSMGEYGPPAKCSDYPFGCRYWLFNSTNPVKVCLD